MSAAFAAELVKAMAERQIRNMPLAEAAGLSEHTICRAKRDDHKVAYNVAVLLADALSWPTLVEISAREWRQRCPVCGGYFIRTSNTSRTFCSDRCQEARRRRRDGKGAHRAQTLHLRRLQAAIAEHCRGCEPLGLCRDATCALRPVSPLPLVKRRAA